MRIGIFEFSISRRKKSVDSTVWNRSQLPQRIEFMTPTELREELSSVARHLQDGGKVVGAGGNRKQVLFIGGK